MAEHIVTMQDGTKQIVHWRDARDEQIAILTRERDEARDAWAHQKAQHEELREQYDAECRMSEGLKGERDEARALLKSARAIVEAAAHGYAPPERDLLARIDAALEGRDA